MPNASPGWYPDSANNVQRYWDGKAWTHQTQPLFEAPPGTRDTAPLPSVPPRDSRTWWRKKRFVIPGGVLSAFILLIVLGALVAPAPTPSKDTAATGLPSFTAASTPAPTPTPVPKTPRSSAPTATATPTPRVTTPSPRPTTSTAAPDDGSFAMPKEVGKVLQDAQDDIQRVSGDPVFFSHSHDLLGTRFQVLDANWKVCTQNLPQGANVSAVGHVDFGVVKLDESCP